ARTGPASPGRTVCAPGAMAFSLYRRPRLERRRTMWFPLLSSRRRSRSEHGTAHRKPASTRLAVEALEDRIVPCFHALANYGAGPSTQLVGDFNNDGKADIITASGWNTVSVL